jgi:hypothetical protein
MWEWDTHGDEQPGQSDDPMSAHIEFVPDVLKDPVPP